MCEECQKDFDLRNMCDIKKNKFKTIKKSVQKRANRG